MGKRKWDGSGAVEDVEIRVVFMLGKRVVKWVGVLCTVDRGHGRNAGGGECGAREVSEVAWGPPGPKRGREPSSLWPRGEVNSG